MRVIETEVYEFDELSEEVQEKIVADHWEINVDYRDWWEFIDMMAEEVDIQIISWDLDRGNFARFELLDSAKQVAKNFIKGYGKGSEIVADAENFLKYDNYRQFMDDIEHWILRTIRTQYEYLTSEEAIIETIQINGYEFTKDGKMV
jgi:hypothetical protein